MKKSILIFFLFILNGCIYQETNYDQIRINERNNNLNIAQQKLSEANSLQDFLNLSHYKWSSYELNYYDKDNYIHKLDNARRNWYINHSDLTPDMQIIIREGKIKLGMNSEQVLASWGTPYDKNKDVYSFGIHEQWIYGKYDSTYLYFEDDVLTSWQD
jgi:hypothetical protein